jgi:alkyl hydroperoxide reductase subunit AhpC
VQKINKMTKIIKVSWFKTTSDKGNLCKTYVYEHENGAITINQLFLVDENINVGSGVVIYTRFGKKLYVQDMAFQRKSFNTINYILNR